MSFIDSPTEVTQPPTQTKVPSNLLTILESFTKPIREGNSTTMHSHQPNHHKSKPAINKTITNWQQPINQNHCSHQEHLALPPNYCMVEQCFVSTRNMTTSINYPNQVQSSNTQHLSKHKGNALLRCAVAVHTKTRSAGSIQITTITTSDQSCPQNWKRNKTKLQEWEISHPNISWSAGPVANGQTLMVTSLVPKLEPTQLDTMKPN